MFPRALEVLLIALLVMVTLGVAFQVQNNLLLREMLAEYRRPTQPVVITQGNTQPSLQPQPLSPNRHVEPDAYYPLPAQPRNTNYNTSTQQATPAQPAPAVSSSPAAPDNTNTATANKPEPAPAPATNNTKPEPAPTPDVPERLTPAQVKEWDTFGPTITKTVTDLLAGEYDHVRATFSRDIASVLTRAQLAGVIEPIRTDHGDLKKVLYQRPVDGGLPQNMHTWELNVELVDGHQMLFTVTVDSQKRVAGLYMR